MTNRLETLQLCRSLSDVSVLLGFQPKAVSYLIYKQPLQARYACFEIKKKAGGVRTIHAPEPRLMKLQRRLAAYLYDCLEEIDARNGYSRPHAHGFLRKRSIMTNASVHRGHRFVLNIDLLDFFPNINFGRVRGFFLADKDFALEPAVATTLAQIACHNNSLPQGAPTSPLISNLVARFLDVRLSRLAEKYGCSYSRYADDLTFSTNLKSFPAALARFSLGDGAEVRIGKALQQVLKASKFPVNPDKTRLQFKDSRQEVTGLVVNKIIAVPSEYRRHARAMVHSVQCTGQFVLANGLPSTNLNRLHGILSYINSVSVHRRSDQHNKLVWRRLSDKRDPMPLGSDEKVYRLFLFYRLFYANSRPIILCEGKTDNVYLKLAIRSLARSFPALATIDKSGSVSLGVQFFSYSKTSQRILGLEGATANLASFIADYSALWRKNSAAASGRPCIIVIDQDSGMRPVRSAVNQIKKGDVLKKGVSIVHVVHNLFVVQVPNIAGKQEMEIEDLFDMNVLGTQLKGKVFHRESQGFDNSKHYGKHIFAEAVVKTHWKSIDFSGFTPLLNSISDCVTGKAPIVA